MATENVSRINIIGFFSGLKNKRIRTIRLLSQITFFGLLNGIIFGLSRIPFPAPVSLPAGSPYATVWGGFDAIQYLISHGNFPFLALGVFFLTGVIFGKGTCGWACPVGLWQDILSWFPVGKYTVSDEDNQDQTFWSKMFLLSAIIVAFTAGSRRIRGEKIITEFWTSIPYGVIDPAGTLFVTLFYTFTWGVLPASPDASFTDTLNALGTLFVIKVIFLFLITAISIKIPRAYCRWVCPTGLLLSPMTQHSIITVKRNPVKCEDGCDKCEKACPMDVPLLQEDPEGIANSMCINCGNCIDACPDALSFGIRL